MRKILHWTLALAVAALAWGATPAKKKSSAKTPAKSGGKATGSKATGSKTAGSKAGTKSTAARSGSKNARTAAKTTTWRNRQMVPAPDRYREIQEALAAKGYLSSESANGTWDQASVDALKRFQADQNIDSTGKINSLSLIALGLGPKHGAAPPAEPVPADAKQ